MLSTPLLVGLGGTTRPNSSSERLVRAVLAAAARRGARTMLFGGAELASLPHYAPDSPARTAAQVALVDAVREADAIVLGSPGYHGGMSGLVKNAIDLLEDLRDDRRCYLDGRAIGLVVSAAGWQAGGTTLSALRDVVHALRGWPTPIGISINVTAENPFGPGEDLKEGPTRDLVEQMAGQLLSRAA